METSTFVWLIALPLIASPIVYLSGHLGTVGLKQPSGDPSTPLRAGLRPRPIAYWVGMLALVAAWLPFALAAHQLNRYGTLTYTIGAISLHLDGLGLLLAGLALGLGTFVALYSGPYLAREMGQEKYYAMLVAMVGVLIGLGCAGDLFNLWIWFEAMAITSYLLVAFYREQPSSLEAGIKYLVQSAAGSALVLIGIGLVLSETGSLELARIRAAARFAPAPMLLAAGALFVVGFGVKTALVPLHTWLPDAHSQAPSGISAMLSGVVIEAGLVAMLRSLTALSAVTPSWPVVLMGFGGLNMIVGNLMALRQTHVKRLLAYSSLAHVGYMLVGLGITFYAGDAAGAQGGLFHLFNHGLMKGLAFLAAGALLYTLHTGQSPSVGGIAAGEHGPLTVEDLSGAARRYPLVALTLSLAVLGLGGLPPLAGFMSKWQIFVAGFQTHNAWIGLLVVFAALNSVLSLAYYAPLVNAVYRLEPSEAVRSGRPLPASMGVPLAVLALAVVLIGVWPSLMNWLTVPAGEAVLAGLGG